MRTLKVRKLRRIIDAIFTVFSVFGLLIIYLQLKKRYLSVANTSDLKNAEDFQTSPPGLHYADDNVVNGKLAVQVWRDICGGKLSNLVNSPLFPRFSEESYFISETRAKRDQNNFGQRIVGYLKPKETGYYKFVLYSDDGSELWIGTNGSLGSLRLAASVASRDRIGSASIGEIRFESQISEDFLLEKGNRYPLEIIHIQGLEAAFVELHWIRPGKHYLELITSEYISHSTNFRQTSKFNEAKNEASQPVAFKTTNFYLVAFLTEGIVKRTLPVCDNILPISTGLKTAHTIPDVEEVTVVTNAEDANWRESKEAKKIVDLFMEGLERIFPKKYTIARLFNLARFQPIDANDSGLYILELELAGDGLDYTQRVIEYVYLKNDKDEKASGEVSQLCYPKVLGWSKEAFLHLIVAVNHEGQRLHRFLEKLERIFEENLEVDFRLVVVHSGKSGIDIESILQESLLQNYIVYELEGEFSWARAINHGIKSIQDPTHVVLTAGVHMDLPASIFEDCRKHSIAGEMIYAPVLYALDCGAYPDNPKGSWDSHGYQMIGMYKWDWDRVGGLNERVTNQQAAWDLVSRSCSLGLRLARVKSRNLFRLFYSESRDSYGPPKVY